MQMQEYAVLADYAHIREYVDADENLIHIICIEEYAKKWQFFRPKMGHPRSVFNSEYHFCSPLLLLSIPMEKK